MGCFCNDFCTELGVAAHSKIRFNGVGEMKAVIMGGVRVVCESLGDADNKFSEVEVTRRVVIVGYLVIGK